MPMLFAEQSFDPKGWHFIGHGIQVGDASSSRTEVGIPFGCLFARYKILMALLMTPLAAGEHYLLTRISAWLTLNQQ